MAGSVIDELWVKLGVDNSGFKEAFTGAKDIVGEFGINVDKIIGKLTGPTGVLVALAMVAKAAWDAGVVFDEASSTIAKATGATGDDLDALNESFRELQLDGLEQNIGDVSKAFGELNTRFGSTGETLKKQTKLFADFSDVTGVDMTGAVQDVSRLMQKWNVDADDLTITLDQLAKAGQMSGIDVAVLGKTLSDSGTQLQNMGLGLTDSIALLSSFELAGVKTQTVMAGLNAATVNFTRAGVDAAEGFGATVAGIKNAKSDIEATKIAMEVFGSKAGPELANAIRSGKVDLDAWVKTLAEAGGTVENTAKASDTIGDKMATMSNVLTTSLAPIGEVFISIASDILEILIPVFKVLGESLSIVVNFLRDRFKVLTDVFKTVIDIVKAIFVGDWAAVWNGVKRIVLIVVKNILDTVSFLANQIVNVVNGLISGINGILEAVGIDPIRTMAQVALSTMLGVDKMIEDTYVKAETEAKTSYKEIASAGKMANLDLGKSNDELLDKIINSEEIKKDLSDQEKARKEANAAMDKQFADEAQRQADAVGDAIVENAKRAEEATKKLNDAFNGIKTSLINIVAKESLDALRELGGALAEGGNAGESFADSLKNIAEAILDALPELLLQAGLAIMAVNIPLGLGLLAAAGVAAIAGGIVDVLKEIPGAEFGMDFSVGGPTIVGERGPEIVNLPRGASVTPNFAINQATSGGNTFIFNSPIAIDIGEAERQFRQAQREMAFAGGY